MLLYAFMSFGLMSPSALCCSWPYVVQVDVSGAHVACVNVVPLNITVGYMSFGLMSFSLLWSRKMYGILWVSYRYLQLTVSLNKRLTGFKKFVGQTVIR